MSGEHVSGGRLQGLPSRRTVLGAAAAAATGVIFGAQPAAAHGTLVPHNEIDDQLTWQHNRVTNAVTGPYTFSYNPAFYSRLETWLNHYYSNTPDNWIKPMKLYISHIHRDTLVPSGSPSMH